MWISEIKLNNFRSYVNGSIELSKGINLLVGQNNSGKSTLLRAVGWLQEGSDISPNDIRKSTQNSYVGITLIDSEKYFSVNTATKITVKLSNQGITFDGSKVIHSNINLSPNGNQRNFDSNAFSVEYPFRIPNQEPNNFIYPYLSKRKVITYEENINLHATNSVSGSLKNLSAKVDRLSNSEIPENKEYIEYCNAIIGFKISAVASENGKKAAKSINALESIYLEEMGEGIANLLGLIVDLCIAENQLFLIEEPENDIHPKVLKKLLDLIEKKSETNQFIITTHSNIVVKHLGSLPKSKVFQVTMDDVERIPTSKVEEIGKSSEARLLVLKDLGYDLFDFDIWSGWLFLEESSAERVIREYLIPWFAPKLINRLRTIAANGKDDVKTKFQDFKRLLLFIHLEPIYVNSAWVIIDAGEEEKVIIEELKKTFNGWKQDHFRQLREHDFESYYPTQFKPNLSEEIAQISNITNKSEKRKRKKDMLDELLTWMKENDTLAKDSFEKSASEVINILREIETSITQSIKA